MDYTTPSNLFGIASLIEDEDGDEIDLQALEEEITGIKSSQLSGEPEVSVAPYSVAPKPSKIEYEGDADPFDFKISRSPSRSPPRSPPRSPSRSPPRKKKKKVSIFDEEEEDEDEDEDVLFQSRLASRSRRTKEEVASAAVASAIRDMRPIDVIDIQREHDEDKKIALMEEIDMLKSILKEDNINYSDIKIPGEGASVADMMKARTRLLHRNDRNRCRTFGEEIFMTAAQGLEYLFDGQRDYFGRRPDLTGWSSTVGVKLRRMRFDTSTMVTNVMSEYNFGPMARIGMELIPSAFMHSRMRKNIEAKGDLYTSKQMNSMISHIRDMNE